MIEVVALSGYRGAGKDTTADYLVHEHGFTKLSFAAVLKDMVADMYDIPRNYMDDRDLKEKPLTQYPAIPTDSFAQEIHSLLEAELSSGYWTPRALCILEGSAKRSVYANYWVQKVASRMIYGNGRYVISDMRYRSEADSLRMLLTNKKNFEFWRITRAETINTEDPSERDLDSYSQFDRRLDNKQSIGDLYERVDSLVREV